MYLRKELIGMHQYLMGNISDTSWFDVRAGLDNKSAHAWRAVAYFVADVPDHHAESIERSNREIRTFLGI